MGERLGEGTWIGGGVGSSPRRSFLVLPLWNPSVVGASLVHPWNATSVLWTAGLMEISPFIPTQFDCERPDLDFHPPCPSLTGTHL